jgi:alkylated DNA repair dioxygenase AlkB
MVDQLDSNLLKLFTKDESDSIFQSLRDDTDWEEMSHKGGSVPRLVAVQGLIQEDQIPLYRHPSDSLPKVLPFDRTVQRIVSSVEARLGDDIISLENPRSPMFNHALIQRYRSGVDYISEHADKTLDIKDGSVVANISFGVTRLLRLRPKARCRGTRASLESCQLCAQANRDDGTVGQRQATGDPTHFTAQSHSNSPTRRPTQKIPLSHGSVFLLGPKTNRTHLHGIKQDRRSLATEATKRTHNKTLSERAEREETDKFRGERISVTLRSVATFLSRHDGSLSGQGAPTPTPTPSVAGGVAVAHTLTRTVLPFPLAHADEDKDRSRLFAAFSRENSCPFSSRADIYRGGFRYTCGQCICD